MKSLFNKEDNQEIVDRINTLSDSTPAQWGKMNVSQMLAHCQSPLKVAFGELKLKRGLIGILFGNIAKKKLAGETPFQRNLPTDKNFLVKDNRKFDEEKQKLIHLVRKFTTEGPSGLSKEPHPFFGKLTNGEWDNLMWKHLDHHLKQFGV